MNRGEAVLVVFGLGLLAISLLFVGNHLLTGYSITVDGQEIYGDPPDSTNLNDPAFLSTSDGSSSTKSISCSARCATSSYIVLDWNQSRPSSAQLALEHRLTASDDVLLQLEVYDGRDYVVLGQLQKTVSDQKSLWNLTPYVTDNPRVRLLFSIDGVNAQASVHFDTILLSTDNQSSAPDKASPGVGDLSLQVLRNNSHRRWFYPGDMLTVLVNDSANVTISAEEGTELAHFLADGVYDWMIPQLKPQSLTIRAGNVARKVSVNAPPPMPVARPREGEHFSTTLDGFNAVGNDLILRFHHNGRSAQPVRVVGPVDYTLSTTSAAPGEKVRVTIHDWRNRFFRIAIGHAADVLEFGNPAQREITRPVQNAQGQSFAARMEVEDELTGRLMHNATATALTLDEGTYNVRMVLENGPVEEIALEGVQLFDNVSSIVRVNDSAPTELFDYVFGIDPSALNFTTGSVRAIAHGRQLFKCKAWNFTTQSCEGSWAFHKALIPGEAYEITIAPDDPGFGESSPSTGTPDGGSVAGNFDVTANTFTATQSDDSTFFSVQGPQSGGQTTRDLIGNMTLVYDLSNITASLARITKINGSINYCHGLDNTACGTPDGTAQQMDIYLLNQSVGDAVDVGNITLSTTQTTTTFSLQDTNLSSFLNATDFLALKLELNLVDGRSAFHVDFAPLTVAFIAGSDAAPPNVSDVEVVPETGFVGDVFCLLANVSDASDIDVVTAHVDLPSGSDEKVNLTDASTCNSLPDDGRFSRTFVASADGTYNLTSIFARDLPGNVINQTVGSTFEASFEEYLRPGQVPPYAALFDNLSVLEVNKINSSNDVRAVQDAALGATTFMYFNWSGFNLSQGAIRNVNITLEQRYLNLLTPASVNATIEWHNGSTWLNVCQFNASVTDLKERCRFSLAREREDINFMELRLRTENNDVLLTQEVDFVTLEVDHINTTPAVNISLVQTPEKISPNATVNLTARNLSSAAEVELDILFNGRSLDSFPRVRAATTGGRTSTLWNRTQTEDATMGSYRYLVVDENATRYNLTTLQVVAPYTLNGSLVNSTGDLLAGTARIRRSSGSVVSEDATAAQFDLAALFGQRMDIEVEFTDAPLLNLTVRDLLNVADQQGNITIHRVDDRSYGVDVPFNGSNVTLAARASGPRTTLEIHTCERFNISSGECPAFRRLSTLENDSVYTLQFNRTQGAFGVREFAQGVSLLDAGRVYEVAETIEGEEGALINATYTVTNPFLKSVVVRRWNTSGSPDLNISSSSKSTGLQSAVGDAFVNREFFVNPEGDFDNITVNITARGTKVWKCANFTQSGGCLDGVWVNLLNVTPGQTYAITINPTDPGFGESSPDEGTPDDGRFFAFGDSFTGTKNTFVKLQVDDGSYFVARQSNGGSSQRDFEVFLNVTYNLTPLANQGMTADKIANLTFLMNYCLNRDISGAFACGGTTAQGTANNPQTFALYNYSRGAYEVVHNYNFNLATSAEVNQTFNATEGFTDFLSSGNLINARFGGDITITTNGNDAAWGVDFLPMTVTFDTTPPEVLDLGPQQDTVFNVSDAVELAANATDAFEVDTVLANVTLPNSSLRVITFTAATAPRYNASFMETALPGRYNVTIIANDTFDNRNATQTTFFNVTANDAQAPAVVDPRPTTGSVFNISTQIEIAVNATDNFGVGSVKANVSFPNSTTRLVTLSLAVSNKYNTSFMVPNRTGVYNVTFQVLDTLSNLNDTVVTDFTANTTLLPVVNHSAAFNSTGGSGTQDGSSINLTANVTEGLSPVDKTQVWAELPSGSNTSRFNMTCTGSSFVNCAFNWTFTPEIGRYDLFFQALDSSGTSSSLANPGATGTNFTVACSNDADDVCPDLDLCPEDPDCQCTGVSAAVHAENLTIRNCDVRLTAVRQKIEINYTNYDGAVNEKRVNASIGDSIEMFSFAFGSDILFLERAAVFYNGTFNLSSAGGGTVEILSNTTTRAVIRATYNDSNVQLIKDMIIENDSRTVAYQYRVVALADNLSNVTIRAYKDMDMEETTSELTRDIAATYAVDTATKIEPISKEEQTDAQQRAEYASPYYSAQSDQGQLRNAGVFSGGVFSFIRFAQAKTNDSEILPNDVDISDAENIKQNDITQQYGLRCGNISVDEPCVFTLGVGNSDTVDNLNNLANDFINEFGVVLSDVAVRSNTTQVTSAGSSVLLNVTVDVTNRRSTNATDLLISGSILNTSGVVIFNANQSRNLTVDQTINDLILGEFNTADEPPGTYTARVELFNSTGTKLQTDTSTFTISDTTLPEVFDVRPVQNATVNQSLTLEIAANVTDRGGVDIVFANLTRPDGTFVKLPLTLAFGDRYNASFNATQDGRYNVTFFANDTSSNLNSSVTTFFRSLGAELTTTLLTPSAPVLTAVSRNTTLTCEVNNTGSIDATSVLLIAQADTGSGFAQLSTTSGALQANETGNVSIGTMNVDATFTQSWGIQAFNEGNNLRLRCRAEGAQTNGTSATQRVDVINTTRSLSLSLDKERYIAGATSVATLKADITGRPYNVVWQRSNGSVIDVCNVTGTTPTVKRQTFFESCSLPSGEPADNNTIATFYLGGNRALNVSEPFNITSALDPLEYGVQDLVVSAENVFLQQVQAVEGVVVDNESEFAVNECCSIHVDNPNTGLPIFTGPVRTILADGECRDDFVLDFQTFTAPQDYVVEVEAWQCSDEDLPSKQRRRGTANTEFSVLEHVTNQDGDVLPLKDDATQYAGLTDVTFTHNRTNNFGEKLTTINSFIFANNVTEQDFVFSELQDLEFAVNINTTNVEQTIDIPPELDSGTYRLEITIEYYVDNILRETDIVKTDAFAVTGVNDTLQVNKVFVQNPEGNRTNETTTAPLGTSSRPRLFLTQGMPFDLCINYTNTFTEEVIIDIEDLDLLDAQTASSLHFPEAVHQASLPNGTKVHCFEHTVPNSADASDSWQALLTTRLHKAVPDDQVVTTSDFFFIEEIANTFFAPKFHIVPNATFKGLPGVFLRDELFRDVPVLDDPVMRSQSEVPWGQQETCVNRETGQNFTCDYRTYLSAGENFQVCFAMRSNLDTAQRLFLERITLEDDNTGTTIDFAEEIPRGGDAVGILNEVESRYDVAAQNRSVLDQTINGYDIFCSNPLPLPDDVPGGNSWDVQGILAWEDDRSARWDFESDEFAVNGRLASAETINITSITLDKNSFVPGETMNVTVNFTAPLAKNIFQRPVIFLFQSDDEVRIDQQETAMEIEPGNNSLQFVVHVPTDSLEFKAPFDIAVVIEALGQAFERDSGDFGTVFNVTPLFGLNVITGRSLYFVGDTLSVCANMSNNFPGILDVDVFYDFTCGTATQTFRSLLGDHVERRVLPASTMENVCQDFVIPDGNLPLGTSSCSASVDVEARHRFEGVQKHAISGEFNVTLPYKRDSGWDRDDDEVRVRFNISAPAPRALDIPLPSSIGDLVDIVSINATVDGVTLDPNVRAKVSTRNGDRFVHFPELPFNGSLQKLNITLSPRPNLAHNITSSLVTTSINGSVPLNITYNISLAEGGGFKNGQKRGVIFIYEFISQNGTGTFIDQDDFDSIVTPLILETSVTVGTPTQRHVSMVPKLPQGTYAVNERIRLKEKQDIVFRSEQ